ncbi:MAG: TonB family protein [Pyrinomonadaceae bacterium]|nr:TonB family protein [Pyrinomonadaceae bacterium]
MPRSTSAFVLVLFFLSLAFLNNVSAPRTQAQQRDDLTVWDTARAIDIYRQGNATEAIKQLEEIVKKRTEDAEAWYYLGLAYNSQGSIGDSRPAFEQVVRLRPNLADAHAKLALALIFTNEPKKALVTAQRALELGDQSAESHYTIAEASLRTGVNTKAVEEAETALRINPNFTAALITRSFAKSDVKLYSEAAVSLEQLLAASPNDLDADSWRGQIEELRRRIDPAPNSGPPILSGKEVTLKARVLSKPEPMYSEEARKAGVSGTVVLRAVFTAEGEVKHILITRALGYGLTTHAIRAARKIRFSPAMKDGAPVSMHIQLEYNFNLY